MTDGGRPTGSTGPLAVSAQATRRIVKTIRRAFAEFLAIPTVVISLFLLLALVMYSIDAGRAAYGGRDRRFFGAACSATCRRRAISSA